jgi:hypothetical protein
MKLLKQILISDKMQRPIGNRTMLSFKEHAYNTHSSSKEPEKKPTLNYCPLPTVDPKKEEVDRLLAEYDQLHRRIHQVKHRLQQLGFNSN